MAENKEEQHGTSFFAVDRLTLPCKVACFLLYSALSCITKFSNVFLVSTGLTPAEAGFVSGCCYAISAVAGPCWGLLADKTGYRKLIFMFMCFSLATSGFSWPFIAREFQHPRTQTHANGSAVWNITDGAEYKKEYGCSPVIKTSRTHVTTINGSSHSSGCRTHIEPFSSSLFYAMFSISVITYACLYPTEGLLNSVISNILQTSGTTQSYGKQRMFGGLGFGTASLIAGFAADNFEDPSLSKYTAVYLVFLPYTLLLLPLSFLLFKRTNWQPTSEPESNLESGLTESESSSVQILPKEDLMISKNEANNSKEKSRVRIIFEIFSNFDTVFIMLTALIVGILRTVTLDFLFLLIRDEAQGSRTSMGLSMLANSLPAFLMFPFTKTVIQKLGGPVNSVELSLCAWILRLVLNSYIKNAWLMCLPQTLQCISFALFWAAMIEYVGEISTKEVYMTLFSLLTSIQFGAGGFLGHLIGGAVYNAYGGPLLCRFTALVGAVWLLLMVIHFHVTGWVRSKLKRNAGEEEGEGMMIDLDPRCGL